MCAAWGGVWREDRVNDGVRIAPGTPAAGHTARMQGKQLRALCESGREMEMATVSTMW